MGTGGHRSIWREPRPPDAPARSRLDWVLVGTAELIALAETAFRPGVTWRPVAAAVAVLVIPTLLWRRSHPLACVLIGFGAGVGLSLAQLIAGVGDVGLYAMGAILILLWALVRWGSGREMLLGLSVVTAMVALGLPASAGGWEDVIGGTVMLSALVALAAAFRYRAALWRRQVVEVRGQERVRLARELHDTVAHHVSAIAVQAQAGLAVAAARPDVALAALAVIEAEASQTLTQMRDMVRVLRDADDAEFGSASGITDLGALARGEPRPSIVVDLPTDLAGITPAVDAAVYRLAQESVTNALRHACDASCITVRVWRERGEVRVSVTDDGYGEPVRLFAAQGFGLIGMRERADLLGGTFAASPGTDGGWQVIASLPVAPSG